MYDWVSCLKVTDVTSVVQAIAVSIVAIPAFRGLKSWRIQILGKRKIELAEEALTIVYDLQSAIDWARHPFSHTGEGNDRPGRDDEEEDVRSVNDAYYSSISRLNDRSEQFSRLMTIRFFFRAYFGEEVEKSFTEFVVIRNEINIAVNRLVADTRRPRLAPERLEKYEDTIWDTSSSDEPDEIKSRLISAVAGIEKICKPILHQKN